MSKAKSKTVETITDCASMLLQIPIGCDHINRLRELRCRYFEAKTPLVQVALEVLEVFLGNPVAMEKLFDSMHARASRRRIHIDELRKELLHCPESSGRRFDYKHRATKQQRERTKNVVREAFNTPLTESELRY